MVVKESKERIRSAITNSQFEFPRRRVIVNLAPADMPKSGGRFDLPIAIGILVATRQVHAALEGYELSAELGLQGDLRASSAAVSQGIACAKAGRKMIVAKHGAAEYGMIKGLDCFPAKDLVSVCLHLSGDTLLEPLQKRSWPLPNMTEDISDVRGHPMAKRAMHMAAAGGHNILLKGPPGTGKTFLASRFCTLLPNLPEEAAVEVAALHHLKKVWRTEDTFLRPPFRQPHHTSSEVALIGGGACPLPGEVSLAHHGVLFLDECPEFTRRALEVLREPMESGVVNIARASKSCSYPARFQLIAAMNPCPCGYHGDPISECECSSPEIRRYQNKLSGPLLDRIDTQIWVSTQSARAEVPGGLDSKSIRDNVQEAWTLQYERQGCLNKSLSPQQLKRHAVLAPELDVWLEDVAQKKGFSIRTTHRLIRMARTFADCAGRAAITHQDLTESFAFKGA